MSVTQEVFEQRIEAALHQGVFGQNEPVSDIRTFDKPLRECIRFHSASLGPPVRATFVGTVAPGLCNKLGNLHGGCSATMIDVMTSILLVGLGKPGIFSRAGVSRALHVTFLKPVPQGVEFSLECELVHAGRRLALLKAVIRRVDTGELCVTGEHDKANTDPPPEKL